MKGARATARCEENEKPPSRRDAEATKEFRAPSEPRTTWSSRRLGASAVDYFPPSEGAVSKHLQEIYSMKKNGAATENPRLAPFADGGAAPADAGMWPAHPAAWLEPQLPPPLPAASGLCVELRYTVPAPDFLPVAPAAAAPRAAAPSGGAPAAPANIAVRVPASGLAPLGWEPRAACRRGDR